MKATVDRRELAAALRSAGKFLPRIGAIPALAHYLIEAHSGILAVTAMDHEAGRRVELEAAVETPGEILVPAALAGIVAGAEGDEAALMVNGGGDRLVTAIGRSTNILRLGQRDDYPEAPEPETDEETRITVTSWERLRAIASFAGGPKTNAQIQGVLLDGNEAVATDSYRMVSSRLTDSEDHPPALIPAKAVVALDALPTSVEIGERHVKATTEDGAWWSRQIEGVKAYPKWRSFMDRIGEPTCVIEIDSERLVDALARSLHVVSSDRPVFLHPAAGVLAIKASQQDVGEFQETIDCDVKGDGVERIAFNPVLLRSMVEPVDHVRIEIEDPAKAARIEGDEWWHGVMMPVRVPA